MFKQYVHSFRRPRKLFWGAQTDANDGTPGLDEACWAELPSDQLRHAHSSLYVDKPSHLLPLDTPAQKRKLQMARSTRSLVPSLTVRRDVLVTPGTISEQLGSCWEIAQVEET